MRICLVSRELEPFFGAGIGVYASAMARAWAAGGHEVHVVTMRHAGLLPCEPPTEVGGLLGGVARNDPQLPLGARLWDGVVVHCVDPVEREDLPYFYLRHALGVSRKIGALHAAHPFDYIEFADYFAEGAFALHGRRRGGTRLRGALLGVRLHTPSIDCQAINLERELPAETAAMGPLEYRALAAADVLVSPSRALLERVNNGLDERGLRRPPGRVVAYPFDVDAPALRASPTARARADDPQAATVLCFGRLERRKGVHVLADAAVRLLERGVDARFTFVGGDTRTGPGQSSMRAHLRSIIKGRWEDRVTIESARPRDDVLAMVRSATVCCFPAIWDNFPNALLEAMALGKAVVATSGSGPAEIIEDGRSGLLVEPGDAEALARGLERALSGASLREQMGGEARRRVRELCDPARIVGEMEALIRESSPSMGRQLRRWRELAPAAESHSAIQKLRPFRIAQDFLRARRRG